MKKIIVLCALVSTPAFAGGSTASISGSVKQEVVGEEGTKVSGGFSAAAWNDRGIAWWTWTGYGQELEQRDEGWFVHSQGVDFPLKQLKVGPFAEWKVEDFKELSESKFTLGARASLKLW